MDREEENRVLRQEVKNEIDLLSLAIRAIRSRVSQSCDNIRKTEVPVEETFIRIKIRACL